MNDSLPRASLSDERSHLDDSRAALARMRQRTEHITDNTGDELAAYALGKLKAQRLADLADRPDTPLFFGRLQWTTEDFHIGRRHVVDESGTPMVLDWRAPLSRTFYQASARDSLGVILRRRFGFSDGALTGFEDENLASGAELGETSRILAAEIERPRVGPMRDIVATIQPEQDDLVRADLARTICVQGAPGTGKTAVGLHRAAYLLYAFGSQLKRGGALIVGPNRAFMSYIHNVLPTLGEVDVTQTTVDDLTATVPVRGTDSTAAQAIKHDVRMAEVLRRAVWGHVRLPEDSLMIPEGGWRWRIGTEYLRAAVADTRDEGIPYEIGRERVRAQIVTGLRRQAEIRSGESPSEVWVRRMGRTKVVTAFLESVWPKLEPKKLLAKLYTDAEFRATAADGVLTDDEQALLAATTRTVRHSVADTVLLDEIAGLLDRHTGFGHVVIDEAQDLSPMQCRVIARRCRHGSVTVLGDLAQGTAPWAARDWTDTLGHLGKDDGEVVGLTTGFRVPADVIALANRLLPSLDVNVPPARSLRRDGLLELLPLDGADDLDAAVRAALTYEGSVAVIAADDRAAGLPGWDDDRVSVVPATEAKGLEFDHVIVVEPSEIVDAEPMGLRRLYVVLTRAVSRLTVLHAKPLPGPLSD